MELLNDCLEFRQCPICEGTRWWGHKRSLSSKWHLGFRCGNCASSNKACTGSELIWLHKITSIQDKDLLSKIKACAPDKCKDCGYRGIRTNFCYLDVQRYDSIKFCFLEHDNCLENEPQEILT